MEKKNDIAKAEAAAIQSVEQIENLILTIRGKQVILDLYTKNISRQLSSDFPRSQPHGVQCWLSFAT